MRRTNCEERCGKVDEESINFSHLVEAKAWPKGLQLCGRLFGNIVERDCLVDLSRSVHSNIAIEVRGRDAA